MHPNQFFNQNDEFKDQQFECEPVEEVCNFDKLLNAFSFHGFRSDYHSLNDFLGMMQRPSIFGCRVHTTDNMNPSVTQVLTFQPTLSSLNLLAYEDKKKYRTVSHFD